MTLDPSPTAAFRTMTGRRSSWNAIDRELPRKARELRRKDGLSIRGISERLGCSVTSVKRALRSGPDSASGSGTGSGPTPGG